MIKYIKLLACVAGLFFTSVCLAQPEQIDRANQLYSNKKYAEASEIYQSLVNQGWESADLYYNLANSYYKQSQIGAAILYYEKALKVNPSHSDAKYNLLVAQQLVVDKVDVVEPFFLKKWYNSFRSSMSSNQWATFGVVIFIVSLLGFSMFLFLPNLGLKQFGFYSGIVCLVIALFSFNSAGSLKKYQSRAESAIIFEPSVSVKSSPSNNSTELFILHEGTKVSLRQSMDQGEWYEVVLTNGDVGWVRTEAIKII